VITGFNTDIEHDGVVYHVQTEDKGLDTPLLLSLVYVGGEILAAKRSRYDDLIAAGFSEEVLSKRLKRQHQLICAAINAGRIEDLKRMGAKVLEGPAADAPLAESTQADPIVAEPEPAPAQFYVRDTAPLMAPFPIRDTAPLDARLVQNYTASQIAAYTVHDPRRQAPQSEVVQAENGVVLTILDEEEFRAGELLTIHILLADRSGKKEKGLAGVLLSVKILGTGFRPQIYSVKTERDGLAAVEATMPSFTSGRAAVLVRAVVKGETIEVRRVIYPAE
jgi:hypothetical protein